MNFFPFRASYLLEPLPGQVCRHAQLPENGRQCSSMAVLADAVIQVVEPFDPYHIWLGIPPLKQPPNHYCLLGIDLFESNPLVIENAADQRMTHLRRYQSGPNSVRSQKLLNEVATAKLCLLRPDKKTAYDQCLRQDLYMASDGSHPFQKQSITVPEAECAPPDKIHNISGEMFSGEEKTAATWSDADFSWFSTPGSKPVLAFSHSLRATRRRRQTQQAMIFNLFALAAVGIILLALWLGQPSGRLDAMPPNTQDIQSDDLIGDGGVHE